MLSSAARITSAHCTAANFHPFAAALSLEVHDRWTNVPAAVRAACLWCRQLQVPQEEAAELDRLVRFGTCPALSLQHPDLSLDCAQPLGSMVRTLRVLCPVASLSRLDRVACCVVDIGRRLRWQRRLDARSVLMLELRKGKELLRSISTSAGAHNYARAESPLTARRKAAGAQRDPETNVGGS